MTHSILALQMAEGFSSYKMAQAEDVITTAERMEAKEGR